MQETYVVWQYWHIYVTLYLCIWFEFNSRNPICAKLQFSGCLGEATKSSKWKQARVLGGSQRLLKIQRRHIFRRFLWGRNLNAPASHQTSVSLTWYSTTLQWYPQDPLSRALLSEALFNFHSIWRKSRFWNRRLSIRHLSDVMYASRLHVLNWPHSDWAKAEILDGNWVNYWNITATLIEEYQDRKYVCKHPNLHCLYWNWALTGKDIMLICFIKQFWD